jgi:hypothetical protein
MSFSGSLVDFFGDGVEVLLGIGGEVCSFGKMLPDEAICISFVPRCHGAWGSAK